MTINVLFVVGSHRPNGSTEQLIKEAAKEAESLGASVNIVRLADKEVAFCRECPKCSPEGRCVLEDDVGEILRLMKEADAIIIGTPVFFGQPSSKLKALMDRTRPLRRKLKDKVGGVIAVGALRHGGQETCMYAVYSWMLAHDMIVVGGGPTAHLGAGSLSKEPSDVLKDELGLQAVRHLVRRVIEVASLIKGKTDR